MSLTHLPLSTPSLLFPAISLLMLAYTNRFLGLANVVRSLHASWRTNHDPVIEAQIISLSRRIGHIRNMQVTGILSLIACTVSMGFLFFDHQPGGPIAFGLSLLLMTGSLTLSLVEISMSGAALQLQLGDMRKSCRSS